MSLVLSERGSQSWLNRLFYGFTYSVFSVCILQLWVFVGTNLSTKKTPLEHLLLCHWPMEKAILIIGCSGKRPFVIFFCCLLSGFCLNFKAHTQKQTDIMLVTLVPLLASEPGDQDSVKEASLECLLKDEKGTEEACPLFIFSTRCCLDLNLSRCVSNRPVKQRWIIWLWWQGHTGQLWLAPSSVTRHHCITVTFLLLNQTWPTEHIPSNSQHCSLLSSSCYQAKSWPMASFPSSVEQNNTWHQPDR